MNLSICIRFYVDYKQMYFVHRQNTRSSLKSKFLQRNRNVLKKNILLRPIMSDTSIIGSLILQFLLAIVESARSLMRYARRRQYRRRPSADIDSSVRRDKREAQSIGCRRRRVRSMKSSAISLMTKRCLYVSRRLNDTIVDSFSFFPPLTTKQRTTDRSNKQSRIFSHCTATQIFFSSMTITTEDIAKLARRPLKCQFERLATVTTCEINTCCASTISVRRIIYC